MTSAADEIFEGLTGNPVLGLGDPVRLRKIVPHCRLVRYRAGRRFLREGEPAEHVYALVSGGCRVFHAGPDESEFVVKLFGAPVFFGESDVLLKINWLESVETVLPSSVIEMPAAVFRKLVSTDQGIATAMVHDLARRLLIASEQARAMAFGSAEGRIAALFVDYLGLFGQQNDEAGGQLLTVRLSQEQIARSLSLSRKTIQRTLQHWMSEGIMGRYKARYLVLDGERLRNLAPGVHFGIAYTL